MTIKLSISRNMSAPSGYLPAYKISIDDETDDETHPLKQRGPVFNNGILFVGVFSSMREAITAAAEYIGAPFELVQWVDGSHSVKRLGTKGATIVARNTTAGLYIRH